MHLEIRYVSQNNFVFHGINNGLVLVCSGCYNKIPQATWLIKNRNFSQLWKLEVQDQDAGKFGM